MAALCGLGLLAVTRSTGAAPVDADPDLPGTAPNLEWMPAGSLVIPMDNALQVLNGKPFNMKSYGLVNALLQAHIPVKWAIASGKAKDAIDFTAPAQRILPSSAAAANRSFRAGPFLVHRDFAALARPVMAAFGGNVAVYELTAHATVDIRYTLAHKPRILVLEDGGTQTIHTKILAEAGFSADQYAVVHAAEAQYYASNSCYTLVTAPHYKPSDLQRATNEARSIRTFLEAGGNFLAQCASVRTYENNTHFGHFQCSHGLADDNRSSGFTYPNADLAFSQFQGELADESGNLQDWKQAATSRLVNSAHMHVRNVANTNSMAAAASKLATGKVGSMVFYLGGHDYAGDKIASYNGRRMYLNSVFVPSRRPADCGFNFGTDLAASIDDGVTTVQPGQRLTYTIVVTNGGPSSVVGATVVNLPPAELADVVWTSVVTGDAVCPVPAGTGAINQLVDLPTGGTIVFTVQGTVIASTACLLTHRVTVTPPAGIVDTTPGNNQAEDVDRIAAPVRAPADLTVECAGQVPLPVTELAQFLALGGVAAGDCCGTPPTLTHVGDVSNGGQGCPASPRVISRTYRLSYACMDAAECRQTITLIDTTPPQIVCPPNLVVQRMSRVPAPNAAGVAATDNCGTPSKSYLGDRFITNGAVVGIVRTYAATDACGNRATCDQLITVDPSLGAPAAATDRYSVNEDTVLTISAPGLLGNDTDPDGDVLTAILVTGPAHGTLTVSANGSFTYRPSANFYGSDSFTYKANDGAADSNPVQVFITVNPVNDPPTLDPTANRSINEDAGAQTIPLTGITSGAANENDPLSVTVVNSNPGLLSGVTVDYTNPNSTGALRFNTVPDAFGTATLTITVNDGGASNNLIARTFTITVNPVNDPPTLDPIPDLTILEDAGLQIIPLTGISSGAANEPDPLTVTVVNSNPGLLTDVTIDYTSPNSVGTLFFTTVSNAIGTAVITLTVNDGGASNNIVTQTFTVTVWPDDGPPQLDPIPDLVIDEDAGLQSLGLRGIRTKARYQIQELTVTRTDRSPALLTSPDVDYLPEAGGGTVSFGTLSNAFGSASYTVTVTDNQAANNTASRSFQVVVLPVNDPPTLDPIPDLAINEDAGAQLIPLTGITSGALNEDDPLSVSVSNSNPALLTGVTVDYASPNSAGALRFATVPNAFGTATLAVTVNDGQPSNNIIRRTFTVVVNPVNDPPTLDPISSFAINEDAGTRTVPLTGITSGAANELQTLTVTASNSNPALLTGLTVDYASPNATGTLRFTTVPDASGTATITVRVNDGGASNNLVTRTFIVTVNPVNDPPTFTPGPDQRVNQNAGPQTVANWATAIRPGPADEAGQQVTFLVNHDRPGLFAVPPAISANGTLTYTPAANAYGVATVTVLLQDNGGTANGGVNTSAPRTFTLTVNAPPTISLTKPTNGTVFIAPAVITLIADAADPDGTVSEVKLFQGAHLLSTVAEAPYYTIWTNVPPGQYQFTAQAMDNWGSKGTSAPVNVTVLSNPPVAVIVPMRFNPQTGLFEQKVRVSNPTPYAYDAVRLWVKNLPARQTVFNASGRTNGVPYVQSNLPVAPGSSVDLLIEYYVPDRLPVEPLLVAELISPHPSSASDPKGMDLRVTRSMRLPDDTFLLEFMSVANRTYYIKYSDDLNHWKTALPSITGSGSRIQWLDNGPPRTEPSPASVPRRYYRVVVLP